MSSRLDLLDSCRRSTDSTRARHAPAVRPCTAGTQRLDHEGDCSLGWTFSDSLTMHQPISGPAAVLPARPHPRKWWGCYFQRSCAWQAAEG